MANQNTNSLMNKFSRYVGGGETEIENNRIEWWERSVLEPGGEDISYTVEDFYAGRLDLIASVFYNEPRWWWIIAQYNSILDPFAEIVPGRVLLIPTKDRISAVLSAKMGGIESKKQPINTISPVII
jgi:hypothetical protein